MAGHRSSDKGKGYEREVAKLLSEWCGFELIRTPMSGAWPGTSGDILPKVRHQPFPFLVECKKEEDWCMEQLLGGRGLLYTKWLPELDGKIAKDEAHGHSVRSFILIFSRNHKPNYVAWPQDKLPPPCITHINLTGGTPLYIFELALFLQHYKYINLVG